jgi:hypothetical protein
MEWIIIDDGTDSIRDLIDAVKIPQIRYFREEKKMALGQKRNYMHSKIKGTIVVYMDDDDYYPPERVSHAVDTLQENRDALCAGSSEIYVYFKHIHTMYQSGPYGPSHATAGTFAFRAELLKDSRYDDTAALAEEKNFLKNYTVPFVQLDPLKTILVFSHNHNTFDKRRLLENPHPEFFKPSLKTVEDFIRTPGEARIKHFFMTDIDALLARYAPGEPCMKPDVLQQIKEIEEERSKMNQPAQQGAGAIMINEPGKQARPITQEEIVVIMNKQLEELNGLRQKNEYLENMVANLQKKIAHMNTVPASLPPPPSSLPSPPPSSSPSPSPSFVDTLLERIKVLENENAQLKNQTKEVSSIPKANSPNIIPLGHKSKSMPEVKVDIR